MYARFRLLVHVGPQCGAHSRRSSTTRLTAATDPMTAKPTPTTALPGSFSHHDHAVPSTPTTSANPARTTRSFRALRAVVGSLPLRPRLHRPTRSLYPAAGGQMRRSGEDLEMGSADESGQPQPDRVLPRVRNGREAEPAKPAPSRSGSVWADPVFAYRMSTASENPLTGK